MIILYTPRRPVESRDALHSLLHDTILPTVVTVIAVLFFLAIGAFAARRFHVVGLILPRQSSKIVR